jgi:hypothetical protein
VADGGGSEKCIQNFFNKNLKERDHLENVGADRKVILIDCVAISGEACD